MTAESAPARKAWRAYAFFSNTAAPTRADRWIALAAGVAFFALCLFWTRPAPISWNDISRTAAIESWVARGTWAIDNSPWFDLTRDRVYLDGHFYSGKMPLLSAVGAVEYAVLHAVTGMQLIPDCAAANSCAYPWVTLGLVGLPAAVVVGLFYLWGRHVHVTPGFALVGTLALALGTMFLPYSLVLNHHLPAGASLFIAFYLLMTQAPRDPRWLAGAGLFASFAVMCDPLSGLLATALFVIAAWRFRLRAAYYILGALVPVLLTVWLDLQITGGVLPPYLTPRGYQYEGSEFSTGPAGTGSPDDIPQYAFKMLLGAQGLYAYSLVLLFAVLGLALVIFKRGNPIRVESIILGAGLLALTLYLIFRTGNLGGTAYGERWYINAVPLLMGFVMFAPPLAKTRGRVLAGILFVLALYFSIYSALQGAHNPWQYYQPPFHLTRDAQTGAIGFRWNLRNPFP